ncbi:MAG: hypothetical protein LAO20_02695 [Acidobacteriia bacterium]|nr:hypothetical protein [Terriglobia bacterium]
MSTATVTDRHGNQYVAVFPTTSGCGPMATNHLPSGGGGVNPLIDDAPMGDQYCPQVAFAQQVTDSNGNRIAIPVPGVPGAGTDTVNRVFPLSNLTLASDFVGCVSVGGHAFTTAWTATYPAPDGTSRSMKWCYANITIQTSFNTGALEAQNAPGVTPPVQSSELVTVIQADGSRITFDYDSYGNLTYVGLPGGGSITYAWGMINFPSCTQFDGGISRAILSRTVTDNNGHSSVWQYQWGTVANGIISNTVTDPLNNDTVHVFTALDGTGLGGCGFHETQTQHYQGTGGSRQLLQQVDTQYSSVVFSVETGWGQALGNVFATDVTTTIYPSGKVKKVHRDPDAGLGAGQPIFGNVVTEKEYDWGQGSPGPLLREVDTTYQWQVDGRYLTAGLLDLPASVTVKDGSGCVLSKTSYGYDETYNSITLQPSNISTQLFSAPYAVRGNQTSASKWLWSLTSGSCASVPAQPSVVSHTIWYDTGEPYQKIDALGHTTTLSYHSAYAGAYVTQTCSPTTGGSVIHCVSGTYNFNTGMLTSLTNENATTQASGNTPGDSAHTSNYSYDYMFRITSAQAPPDPANGSLSATTSFSFSTPNTFPLTVTRSTSITTALTDSATATFDGLNRPYKMQHVTPGGTAIVDTAYDLAAHVGSVSNPYFTTADPTYGITASQFDALDRVTQTTKQDGSISLVSYDITPPGAPGVCTQASDEAGKQRLTCADAVGRLVEVHEPNPNAAASNATGSVSISGSEQTGNSQQATSGHTTVTISGDEQSACLLDPCPPHAFIYDAGTVSITVNGAQKQVSYSRTVNTPSLVAAALRDAFHNDASAPADASCSDQSCSTPVITLTARATGASTNYAFSTASATGDTTGNFFDASFAASPASGALTGGQNGSTAPDTGTVTITVNGTAYTTTYGNGDTTALIATRLAGLVSAGSWANAVASGGTVNLTSKSAGPASNYPLSTGYTWNSSQFTQPSFTTTASGAGLTGGYNASDINNNPYVTQYQYDGLGNLLRVDQKGSAPGDSTQWRTRLFTYDSLSRLLTAQNPESGTISYTYDADGELLMKTSPAPNHTDGTTQTVSYCYDELHRSTKRDYQSHTYAPPACPITAPVVSYVYDSGDNAKGHLTSLTDQAGSASYSYDILGRLTGETRVIGSISKSISYAYHLGGSVKTLTYPNGHVVTYTPDFAGQVVSAVDSGSGINYATAGTYNAPGSLTSLINGNTGSFAGITNTFSYNKRLQPVNMSSASPSQTVFSIGYDFHAGNGTAGSGTDNGNVLAITNNKDTTRSQTFTYDLLNRLISAQNTGTDCTVNVLGGQKKFWGNSYVYDAWGNLLQKNVTKCSAENLSIMVLANNRIGTSGYGYDAAGNMNSDATDGVTAVYDAENRIATATKSGVTTTYTYDADGNRVKKITGSTGTLYWYMTPGIVAESDQAGTLKSEYVFFDGERVARRDLLAPTGVFYYFADHLKTASVVTDAAGVIKAESDYYPWGGELQFVANDSNHYKFTGKERDSESGLDYFGARYYSNGLGRFVSADWSPTPIPVPYAHFEDPQSLNLYGYVGGVPTSVNDPDGHGWWDEVKGAAVGTANFVGNTAKGVAIAAIPFYGPYKAAQVITDTVTVAAQDYYNKGASGVMNAVLDQGPQGAMEIVTEAVLTGGATAYALKAPIESAAGTAKAPLGMAPKEGEAGGPGAGKRINDTTKGQALQENKAANGGNAKCVFCKEKVGPGTDNKINFDHAKAKAGNPPGNNSLNNTNVTCEYCNKSKGTGDAPKNPKNP